MSFYRTGTITVTNGSASVAGSGTDFITGAAIGECVQAPDGKLYEILSIQSSIALTLGQVYLGTTASGQAYSIVPTQSYTRDLTAQAATLFSTYADTKNNAILLTVADKATPVDADKFAIRDSVNGLAKLLTFSNLKTYLLAAFKDTTGGLAGLTLFKLNLRNAANTFTSFLTNAATAARTWTMPDKDGTVAMTSDISGGTSAGSFTTLSATGALTTAGIKEDAAGNLGIGVTPTTGNRLQVDAGSGVNGNILLSTTNGSYPNQVFGFSINDANSGMYLTKNGSGVISGGVSFKDYAGAFKWVKAADSTVPMALDAGGNLMLGQSASGLVNANSLQFNPSAGNGLFQHVGGSASGNSYAVYAYAGGSIGSITQSGTTAVAYNTTSDHRLKENVRPANAARFMDIEFVDFEWVDGRHDCGVIAGQLQSVYPDLVLGAVDASEVRQVEITPAIPATSDKRLMEMPAGLTDAEIAAFKAVDANYDWVEITPAVPAVTEEQTFPVYQQVNYTGLIGRTGTRVQQLQRTVDAQAALIESLASRLTALESK